MQQKGTHVGLIEWDVLEQWFIIVPTSQPIQRTCLAYVPSSKPQAMEPWF